MPSTIHNHKAGRDYLIGETFEAGIELKGTEVKSLRAAKGSIEEAFARVEKGQVWLYNAHIAPYEFGNRANVDSLRPRRLLLNKTEINRITGQLINKGMALLALKLYFNNKGFAKVLIAIGKGKTGSDKRETMKRKTDERETNRAIADRMRQR